MIFGGCPYCDASQANPFAGIGKLQKIECADCHRTYWLKHSNLDPEAYTEEQFAERYEVNETTHTIVDRVAVKAAEARKANPALAALMDKHAEHVAEIVKDAVINKLIYGIPSDVDSALSKLLRP